MYGPHRVPVVQTFNHHGVEIPTFQDLAVVAIGLAAGPDPFLPSQSVAARCRRARCKQLQV
jgi:hypothetical protein